MTEEIKKKHSKTDRIEIFAQAIVDGKTQADAYRLAHPTAMSWAPESVHAKASVMAKEDTVLARVQELRKQMESKVLWSREKSIDILSRIATEGEKEKDQITAVDKLNGMFGYNAPKKIDHTSSDGTMTPQAAMEEAVLEAIMRKHTKPETGGK